MPHTIEIDDATYAYLRHHAEPIYRLLQQLGFDGKAAGGESSVVGQWRSPGPSGRAARGTILPLSAYSMPVLRAVVKLGGRAWNQAVLDAVEEELESSGLLTPIEREPLKSGKPRWRSRCEFARARLVAVGYLDGTAPRGIWEITEQGRERVRRELAVRERTPERVIPPAVQPSAIKMGERMQTIRSDGQ